MNKFLVLVVMVGLMVSSVVSARSPKRYETVYLFSDSHHQTDEFCDTAIKMQLDYFINTITLEHFVVGSCEIKAEPDFRSYVITDSKKENDVWHTTAVAADGVSKDSIEIYDYRRSENKDKGEFMVIESRGKKAARTMYSEK